MEARQGRDLGLAKAVFRELLLSLSPPKILFFFLVVVKSGSQTCAPKPRTHGLSTEQVPVSAYVGSSKNLKDLKTDLKDLCLV